MVFDNIIFVDFQVIIVAICKSSAYYKKFIVSCCKYHAVRIRSKALFVFQSNTCPSFKLVEVSV